MSKYLSAELWKPSDGFITTKTAEKIIKENQRNLSILAGPGAGKTELLAQRANFILQTGACKAPQKILALSFKVDAAANIKNRVDLRCGRDLARRFDSSTFDAFFYSLVCRFSPLLPDWIKIPPGFDVYFFDHNWWGDYERIVLNGRPCQYKKTFSPLDLTNEPNEEIVKIWDYCAENKVADYDMCRSMALTIVKNNSQVRNLILSTYKYLFLDEFQDTTDPQYDFVKTIFEGSDTIITAVGDTNQMIMSWAGANPKNFKNLKKDFNSEAIPLAVNHRSNSKIVDLINHVIKDLTPPSEEPIIYEGARKAPPPVNCMGAKGFDNAENEAEYISKYINLLMSKTPSLLPSDFVLILRQRAQDYFDQANETFQNNSLNLRNEDALVVENGIKIQDLMSEPLSIFWILLIRYKTGFINYTQEKELENIASSLTGYDLDQDRDYKKLRKYIADLALCIDLSNPIENAVAKIVKTIGKTRIKAIFPQYRSQYLNKVGKSFCLLFQDALDKNPKDIKQAIENYEGTNQVKLMTIHKSKGLEFDTVFFVDFHDDSWWGLRQAVQQKNAEKQREEKNSFFVGLSRAEERLFFTKSKGSWPPVIAKLLKDSKLLISLPDAI
ncbi:UvrD-helicase domain-containing protein [Marinomonas mediterranea]|uniref:UvrD-helicase domain-containing protein n=1 Tax=Marinomonas mediterranea TaxID=119864 RepID=UPI0023495E89|nr:ATP-dependent helicase [Marinomonas mediterranea]